MKKTLLLLVSLFAMITANAAVITFDATTDKAADGELTLTKDGVTMTIAGGTLSNGSEYRFYKGQNLTITSNDAMTYIVFTCTVSGNAKYGPGCFTADCGNYTYSDVTGTWNGSSTTVVFTPSTNQVRATKVVVYTGTDVPSTGSDTPDPEPEEVATEVTSLKEALALEDGTKVVIKAESALFPIYQSGKYNYIYDATDYTTFMLAYGTMTSFVPGQTISELGGTITTYNGGKQLAVDNTLTVAGTDYAALYAEYGYTITSWEDLYVGPTQKTGLADLSDATDLHACWYKLSGCTISGINNKNFTLMDADGNTLAGYNQFGAVDLSTLAEGDEVVVEGFMQNFKGTMEILPTKISSFASMTIAEVNAAAVGTPATLKGKIGVIAQFDDDEWYQTELWVKDVENDTYLHIQADNLLDNSLPLGTILNEGVKGQTAETYDGSVVFNAYATSIVASDEKVSIEPTVRTIAECEVNDEYVTLKGVTITKEQYMGTFISDGENRATIVSYYNFCDLSGLDTTGATQYNVTGLVESAYGDVYFYPMSYTEAVADGINNVNVENNAPIYNIAGQRVNGVQKGMFIQNGKKFIVK